MKSGVVIGIVIVIIVIAVGIFFLRLGVEDQGQGIDSEDNAVLGGVGENSSIEENPINETKNQGQETEFKIFQPSLTYEGMYNGPLYATSEQIGNYPIDAYMSNLDRNGVNFFVGFFGIEGEQSAEMLIITDGLGYTVNGVEKYPGRIIPFFSPGYGGGEIEERGLIGDKLTKLYSDALSSSKSIAGDDFIQGFGEIETQEWSVRHNSPKVLQLIDLASSNNINFMFHPVASKISDVENIVERYPDMNFIIHMYRSDLAKSKPELIEILKTHDNLFFSIDAAHIIHLNGNDVLYDYADDYGDGDKAKDKFIATVNDKYESILNGAVIDYKELVEAAPGQIMWGTEAGPDYAFEPEVYDIMVKASRDLISRLSDDPEIQEDIGYKNALRGFGPGIVLDKEVNVYDTSTWPTCTEDQVSSCDNTCEIESDGDTEEYPDKAKCFLICLYGERCVDIVEDD